MEATLTGQEATQALKLIAALGAGARFDAARVLRDVRSAAGRARLRAALLLSRRSMRMTVRPASFSRVARRATRRPAARRRAGSADPSRERPAGREAPDA